CPGTSCGAYAGNVSRGGTPQQGSLGSLPAPATSSAAGEPRSTENPACRPPTTGPRPSGQERPAGPPPNRPGRQKWYLCAAPGAPFPRAADPGAPVASKTFCLDFARVMGDPDGRAPTPDYRRTDDELPRSPADGGPRRLGGHPREEDAA